MAADPRRRNVKSHATAPVRQMLIEWASPKQKEVFEYGPWPQCASGGFGSAKTYAFCLKALYLSELYPNNRGIIARREFELLKNTTMSTFFKICPPQAYMEGGKRSDSEKYLRLNNGSEILWMHMDDPETENVIRGLEINWFYLDQAEELREEIADLLMTRLGRWDKAEVPDNVLEAYGGLNKWPWKNPVNGKPLVPTFPMFSCNPDTELHWIYKRFHPESEEWQQKYKSEGYKMWIMSSEENKFLPKQNLDMMLSKDPSFVRRFVKGLWGIPEGQIHEINPLSIVKGSQELLEKIRATCTLHRTLDHGDASPTCCIWWAVDGEGNVFAYREYYQPDKLISYHRREITALSDFESYQFQLADPSIFHKVAQKNGGRWSTADEYSDCKGLPRETALFWSPADNNELGTRNRINEYLQVDPKRIHPITKQRGAPRLFFVVPGDNGEYPYGCRNLVREIKSQRRLKIASQMGKAVFSDERDETIPDHAVDCCRYFIASRPPVSVELPKGYSKWSWRARHDALMRFQRRGGWRKLQRQAAREYAQGGAA